jgi:radical SAM superfamily enzyme YgiQ (UPF0313 family)
VKAIVDGELRVQLAATEAHTRAVAEDMGNPPWHEATARILIVRLSPFRDIEGSTSHLVLFAECRRSLPNAYIDFSFFPERRDRELLAARSLPFYYGLESGFSPADFDLILVSNAFALELVNLGYLYSSSGMPFRASERARGMGPIVILGGSNAASAGALLYPDDSPEEASDALVDGIFFGEGESPAAAQEGGQGASAIGEIASALTRPGETRSRRLELASGIEGLWLALSGRKASRRILRPYPSPLISYPALDSAGAGTARLQISAGCPGFCSFCLEGWESRPYREILLEAIAEAARKLKAATGASCLEVYSYNFNTHSRVFDLIFELNRVFRRVNFMSQRLDVLADAPSLAEAEIAADKRSFTLGIEGVSERMRRYYRKGVDEGQIDAAIGRLAIPAVRELKLFYMIAGIEDDRDIAEFADFAHRTAETRRRAAPGLRIIVSAGYLARLPFTPLQYAPLRLDRDALEAVADRVQGACAAAGIEFRLATDFEEHYVDQVLALGGRSLAPWLAATCEAGFDYDGSLSRGTGAGLEAFARSRGLIDSGFLGEKGEAWRPPLAFIDENAAALRRAYLLAAGFAAREGRLALPEQPRSEAAAALERLMAAKRGFASTLVRLDLPEALAAAGPEYRASWIMRRISAASPEGGASVFDAEDALFAKGGRLEGMAERFWGEAYYRLRGPDARRMAAAAAAAGFEAVPDLPACGRIAVEVALPPAQAGEADRALRAYLAEERISFIETREEGERGLALRRLRPAPRDERKRVLLDALLAQGDAGGTVGFSARLVLGPKASLASWLGRASYAARRSASIRFVAYE